MGARSILMPDIGEGIAEAEIVEWHVNIGDLVREGQMICAIMTDKAAVEVPTSVAGTVLYLGGAAGDVLAVGSELIRIDAPGLLDQAPPAPRAKSMKQAPKADDEARPSREPGEPPPAAKPSRERAASSRATPLPQAGPPRSQGEKPLASPAVRLRAREAGVDLRQVRGTGAAGRITHDDLSAFLETPAPQCAPGRAPNLSVEIQKVVGLRRRIAENMAQSKRRVAHFSYVEEIDVTALEETRAALNAQANEAHPRLTVLPFLMLAIVRAVADFPQINAHYDDDEDVIRRFGAVHLGIATQTQSGLTVPVVRHAETLGLYECASEMKRVTDAARAGLAAREEMSGSTITLTSLGALGGIVATPIVNRPEVAIIGVNRIVMRPIWRDHGFVPRKTMNLSSSFDHRVIDGFDAASFIQRLRALMEQPALLFVEGQVR
jgi:2-oxoisovalerate dehydrogenase E2 component (dihydrolipoyl transacylase)